MKRLIALFAVLAMLFASAGCDMDVKRETSGYPFEAHYIDVGQADCALIKCDGHAMLIDGGNTEDSRLVASYLRREGIDELDCVVCTHAHEDHVGGLSGALATVSAKTVYAPKRGAKTKAYKNFKKKVKEQGLTLTLPAPNETFSLGGAAVELVGPIDENGKDTNNTSIVLKITYGDTSFLFTGDAERDEEEEILAAGANLKSTVLKVGHHGSSSSTSYPFLREVMPQYAVISCEKGNSYGHPHRETISRLSDAGVEIYRTDESGTIVMLSDGQRVIPITER